MTLKEKLKMNSGLQLNEAKDKMPYDNSEAVEKNRKLAKIYVKQTGGDIQKLEKALKAVDDALSTLKEGGAQMGGLFSQPLGRLNQIEKPALKTAIKMAKKGEKE